MDRPPDLSGAGALLPLAACARQPASRVGRKAQVLALAAAEGVATPGGWVVPAERFWAAVDACDRLDQVRYLERTMLRLDPGHALGLAAAVEAAMAASPGVEALARASASEAWARVDGSEGGCLACRSSAAMEDGAGAAFPGVFTSVLGIGTPDALAAAVAACWRSPFSARAVRYLLAVRAEPVDLSLAVLVQPQVEAAWYGVYVSVDPLTGEGGPLADLSDAGPEALVAGDRATLRARRERESGRWTGADGEDRLERVHRAAERLAGHLGTEVDVEFALPSGGGEPVILQCRPLTRVQRAGGTGTGRGCSAGRAEGWAADPREGAGEGRIAVVDALGPADYEVVFRHAAIVTEQDASPLSHLAILCRELGVPLVCGVEGARSRLVGRYVAVDGGSGAVAVLDAPSPSPSPSDGHRRSPAPEPALGALELVMRVLAEGRPGRAPAAEAARLVRRYARDLGAGPVRVLAHPVAAGDLARLDRAGAALFGPGFSAARLLAEVATEPSPRP
jgi:phosphoenolpyruvate synthase/pyruvate phosphate dikinase